MHALSSSGLNVSSPTWQGGSFTVIPNITQGDRMAGLMIYLAGPGRANEHEEPHLVAGDSALMAWHDDNELNRDAALDIANALDRAKQFFDTDVDDGHVFHCSLSLAAEEGQFSDERWGAIADDFMKEMDFTEDGGKAPARWVAVRHGPSKNGNDHIHIVASMVRDDGTKWNGWKSKYKSQQAARTLEKKYGLNAVGNLRAERGFTPAEQSKAIRQGLPEVERHSLARKVRVCAGASTDEAEFVRRARQEGVLVRPRYAAGRTDVVTGYSVAERPRKGERAVWFGGNSLGRDLALPKLRAEWESTPESATSAVAEWNAAARNRRPVRPGREMLQPSAELWSKYAIDVSSLREKLAPIPHDDHAAWAQAARETSAGFGAWSKRIEPTPGPLADAARELAKSAQLRRYPARPAVSLPSARGATMILLAATSKSDRAAYALMFQQLAQTARPSTTCTRPQMICAGSGDSPQPSEQPARLSKPAPTRRRSRHSRCRWRRCANSTRKRPRKPSNQGCLSNVHEAAHRCFPFWPDQTQRSCRERNHGPKRPEGRTVQASSDRGRP